MAVLKFVLLFVPYQFAMLYAMAALYSLWTERRLRGVPDQIYLIFGLGAPAMGWFLSTFSSEFGLVVAASLAVLCAMARIHEKEREAAVAEPPESAREKEGALQALAVDDNNAVAHRALAQAYETESRFADSLAHFMRAHALDTGTVPAQELAEIKDRLAAAAAAPQASVPPRTAEPPLIARRAHVEKTMLWLAPVCLLYKWDYALNLGAMALCLRWFAPIEPTRPSNC